MKIRELVVQWTNAEVRNRHSRNLIANLTPASIRELFGAYRSFGLMDGM